MWTDWPQDNGIPIFGLSADGFRECEYMPTRCTTAREQSFSIISRTDGLEQIVLLPLEVETRTLAFGPSPLSVQFEQFRLTGECERQQPADFNMIAITAAALLAAKWEGIDRVVRPFMQHGPSLDEDSECDRYPLYVCSKDPMATVHLRMRPDLQAIEVLAPEELSRDD